MAKFAALSGLLAGVLLTVTTTVHAQTPSVEVMLEARFAPKHKDAPVATPTAAELKGATVKAINGTRPGSTGWELTDAKGQPVRRYFAAKGAKGGVDTWCYFKDGVEVYREIDTNGDSVPDQFRWLNAGGLKWGIDPSGKGRISSWRIISAEEVGFEVFQALAANDYTRLQALFITAEEMQALKLPAKEVTRLTALQKQAPKKFADLVKAMPHLTSATFERIETAVPSCVPGESIGAESDLIKFASRTLVFTAEGADKKMKHDWLHTGEMIQVGFAWRLVDVPGTDEGSSAPGVGSQSIAKVDPKVNEILAALGKLDAGSPTLQPGTAEYKKYLDSRIELVRQIIPVVDSKEHDGWYKQLFDNWSSLAQAGDAMAIKNLAALKDQIVKSAPNSGLAGYGVYREMWARYSHDGELAKTQDQVEKLQKDWIAQLTKFVEAYPKVDDTTPEALHQLAMHHEFFGNDKQAKNYYDLVPKHFAEHYLAEKCKGAARRLDLPGQTMELKAPELQTGNPFDLSSIKGKLVVVYYWGTECSTCVGDFARLNKLYVDHPGKLELVCVNLDDTAKHATDYLKATPVRGIHLFQAPPMGTSGSSGPLAMQYGINGLPTAFLIGRDGRVISRSMQMSELENELKKAQ